MNFTILIEVICGLLFLINKIFLLVLPNNQRKIVWFPVFIGGIIALYLFLGFEPRLWALAILQVVGLGLNIRAMIAPNDRSKKIERIVPIIVLPLMCIVLAFTYQSGVSMIDGLAATIFSIGTILFGYETLIKKQLGWICYLIGHCLGYKLAIMQKLEFFALTQTLSAIVAFLGIIFSQYKSNFH